MVGSLFFQFAYINPGANKLGVELTEGMLVNMR